MYKPLMIRETVSLMRYANTDRIDVFMNNKYYCTLEEVDGIVYEYYVNKGEQLLAIEHRTDMSTILAGLENIYNVEYN